MTFDEVIDFLLEFNVIANNRICTERQITAIVQASFPGVVTKPSAKYNVLFVNLENNSDDVVKEELVRVTTEPIIDPASREAQAWIEEEDEGMESNDDREDKELSEIENKMLQNIKNHHSRIKAAPSTSTPPMVEQQNQPQQQTIQQKHTNGVVIEEEEEEEEKTPTGTPRDVTDGRKQEQQNNSSAEYQEQDVDVSFERSPRFKENLNNNRSLSKSTGDVRSGSGLRRNPSFTKRGIDRSISVNDVAKRFENDKENTNDDSKSREATITKAISTSNLQRKRSFNKSTNPTFVGSIKEKFRSSLRRKPKNGDSEKEPTAKEVAKENEKKAKEESEKKKAKEENEKKSSVVVKRGASTRASFTVKSSTEKQSTAAAATKIGPNHEVKMSVRNKTRPTSDNNNNNNRFGGSAMDVSNNQTKSSVNKNLSGSAGDIRSSFRASSARTAQNNNNNKPEVKASYNTTSTRQSVNRSASEYNHSNAATTNGPSQDEKNSNFVRATSFKTNDPRSSVRRNMTSSTTDVRGSVRKSNENRPVVSKSASVRNISNTNATSSRNQSARTLTPRDNSTAKRTGAGLRRSNSRASSVRGSNQSSAASTPNISRENSKTNMKIPIRRQPGSTSTTTNNHKQQPQRKTPQATTQEQKDILRIAKAFEKATNEIEKAKDNVEQFMINVALDDIEPSLNDRLCIDDLYDHIRHRMIMSQEQIFDGYRSDIRVDMSQYFELFFTALASNMSRVGCEIVTDSTTQQKICYLTHVKLIAEHTNGAGNVSEQGGGAIQNSPQDTNLLACEQQQTESDDDMQSSYV